MRAESLFHQVSKLAMIILILILIIFIVCYFWCKIISYGANNMYMNYSRNKQVYGMYIQKCTIKVGEMPQ